MKSHTVSAGFAPQIPSGASIVKSTRQASYSDLPWKEKKKIIRAGTLGKPNVVKTKDKLGEDFAKFLTSQGIKVVDATPPKKMTKGKIKKLIKLIDNANVCSLEEMVKQEVIDLIIEKFKEKEGDGWCREFNENFLTYLSELRKL